jgi:hypothetical protein
VKGAPLGTKALSYFALSVTAKEVCTIDICGQCYVSFSNTIYSAIGVTFIQADSGANYTKKVF